ncbi:MAG: potassium transporter [Candidatus Zixiibacteriota bacterium]|nr:MAG: potassium transporter [candidate division Zixibacteria bacterium]
MLTGSSSTKQRRRFVNPVSLPVLTFTGLIIIGTTLLMLPVAADPPLTTIDALFTATSAACVTGLVVVDTGSRLSLFGQLVVLLLIECGGLGIITFSTVFILLLGGRFSLASRSVIQDTFTHGPDTRLTSLVRHVVMFTLILETVGAALLFIRFSTMYPPGKALYYSIFHAISAFCNAGFSLHAESFMNFKNDPLVNLTLCGLIITGGLGFLVLVELKRLYLRSRNPRQPRRLSVHSKLVLSLSFLLLTVGTVGFMLFEWHVSLAELSLPAKFMTSFFQSVTMRTAGFNTLDFSKMAGLTLILTISLMFVGAASGSTGGGIKANTLGVLFALSRSRLRGEETVSIFRRTLSPAVVGRAIAVFAVSIVVIHLATLSLMAAELGFSPHSANSGRFLELLFEVVSAFGTVGLSVVATPTLSSAGKLIIVAVMFTGRLGPLSIALGLFSRERRARFRYAEENVMIG